MVGKLFSGEVLREFRETRAYVELEQFLERQVESLTGRIVSFDFSEANKTPVEYQAQLKAYKDMLNEIKPKTK
jgi:hypothetical protein